MNDPQELSVVKIIGTAAMRYRLYIIVSYLLKNNVPVLHHAWDITTFTAYVTAWPWEVLRIATGDVWRFGVWGKRCSPHERRYSTLNPLSSGMDDSLFWQIFHLLDHLSRVISYDMWVPVAVTHVWELLCFVYIRTYLPCIARRLSSYGQQKFRLGVGARTVTGGACPPHFCP